MMHKKRPLGVFFISSASILLSSAQKIRMPPADPHARSFSESASMTYAPPVASLNGPNIFKRFLLVSGSEIHSAQPHAPD